MSIRVCYIAFSLLVSLSHLRFFCLPLLPLPRSSKLCSALRDHRDVGSVVPSLPRPLSPLPQWVPLLPVDEYPRGNTRRYEDGRTVAITPEQADRLPQGMRGQRSGLLYDESYPGFEPWRWPRVVPECTAQRLLLEDEEGGGAAVVEVGHELRGRDMNAVAETYLSAHGTVRDKDTAVGRMVGVGDHAAYDGRVRKFVTTDAVARRHVAAAMEVGGMHLDRLMRGRGLGWEDMLAQQREGWPAGTPWWPQCWDASEDLGNAMHRDRDGAPSFAQWLARNRQVGGQAGWWLLFPRHGLAIALTHGTWVRWDGRTQSHCTSVPQPAGQGLLSIFASLDPRAQRALDVKGACEAVLARRSQKRTGDGELSWANELWKQLEKGVKVRMLWWPLAPDSMSKTKLREWRETHKRFVRGTVVEKCTGPRAVDDFVLVQEPNGYRTRLSRHETCNRVLIGNW